MFSLVTLLGETDQAVGVLTSWVSCRQETSSGSRLSHLWYLQPLLFHPNGGGGGKEWEVLRMLLNLPGSGRKSSLGSVGKSLDELPNPATNCGHVPACDGLGTDLQPVLAWSPVGNFGLFSREIVLPWDTAGVFLILPSL